MSDPDIEYYMWDFIKESDPQEVTASFDMLLEAVNSKKWDDASTIARGWKFRYEERYNELLIDKDQNNKDVFYNKYRWK